MRSPISDSTKLKRGQAFLRFSLAALLWSGFVWVGSPALFAGDPAAETDKKKLSEEEEIAQMMDQLQKFKASWEQKKSSDASVAEEAGSAQTAPPEKVLPAVPSESKPQGTESERSVKINPEGTPQGPRVAQIKTQDGQLIALRLPSQPAVKSAVPAAPEEKSLVFKTAAVPSVKPRAAEKPSDKPAVKPIESVKPAKPLKTEVLPVASAPKPAPAISAQNKTEKKNLPAGISGAAVPQIPTAPPPEAASKTSVPEAKRTEISKTPAAPAQPGSGAADDEVLVVQDDAARYQAAQESAESKHAARSDAGSLKKPSQPVLFPEPKPELVVEKDDAKKLDRSQGVILPGDADAAARAKNKWETARKQKGSAEKAGPPKANVFAETFYLRPDQRMAYNVYDIDGFIFVKAPNPALETQYAIVTGFGGDAMKTRSVPGLQTLDDAKQWVHDNLETAQFEGVEIKKLYFGKKKTGAAWYWVGQKAFANPEAAQQEVAVVQSVVESQGGNFAQTVTEAAQYAPVAEAKKAVDIQGPANFQKEEELILKYLDQMDIGEKLFGPFQGEASGEKFSWQSFGETTFRKTNLTAHHYDGQVGFWTNRFVFKGIRFPMSTIDPFVEVTAAFDSTSVNYASNVKFFAGLEWRPFARNPWLANYRPWGGINILEWIKNYRFYIMYGDRRGIKNPIEGSANSDLIGGVQIFYEWGVELPPVDEKAPKSFSEYLEHYFWGEYFGDYRFEKTNFSAEKVYDGVLLNSSIILGLKIPGIPLPENSMIDELALMPYVRYEHVNSAEFSFPYQNQYFVAVGCRWMPFRNYRFKENEWLSKTKIFAEYVGVGKTQHTRGEMEPPNNVRTDLRFGLSFSSRRY